MRGLLALFLVIRALPARGADDSARVIGIADGDRITVLTTEKKPVRIRLRGIDAPETGKDFGSRAKQAASQPAFGKMVTIWEQDKDRYGRTVAEVFLRDGRSMTPEIVRQGLGWWFIRYAPHDAELAPLESEARAAERGLWSRPNPVPLVVAQGRRGAPSLMLYPGGVGKLRPARADSPTSRGWSDTKAGVLALARSIDDERAYEGMPLLAEALAGFGCGDEEVLGHCRGGGPHARGCWVVELVTEGPG